MGWIHSRPSSHTGLPPPQQKHAATGGPPYQPHLVPWVVCAWAWAGSHPASVARRTPLCAVTRGPHTRSVPLHRLTVGPSRQLPPSQQNHLVMAGPRRGPQNPLQNPNQPRAYMKHDGLRVAPFHLRDHHWEIARESAQGKWRAASSSLTVHLGVDRSSYEGREIRLGLAIGSWHIEPGEPSVSGQFFDGVNQPWPNPPSPSPGRNVISVVVSYPCLSSPSFLPLSHRPLRLKEWCTLGRVRRIWWTRRHGQGGATMFGSRGKEEGKRVVDLASCSGD
jgi:hypothetical protein